MCGIAFAHRPDLAAEPLTAIMNRSLGAMAHRGPDDSGRQIIPPVAIGHRRLAVIDPDGSHQPLEDPAGRFRLTYNGELYNYRALRRLLADRWRFATSGDAEVVLAGLVTHGRDFLKLMEGMWALALWDRQPQRLLLVRDRMGQKPLYFAYDDRRFACASQLSALQALSWKTWREDPNSTADFLRYGFFLPGTTAYRRVFEVLPGHWLQWSPGNKPDQQPYWQLSPGKWQRRRQAACEQLRMAVEDGVRRRLVADVQVGALLSGGIDSSLVVAIAGSMQSQPLQTFTMGFDDPSYDERRFARRMARHCGTRHLEDRLSLDDEGALTELVIDHVGQPFADASLLPTYLVCRMAAEQVKVALSGDGGDELFCGYQRYLARSVLRWYTRLPAGLRRAGEKTIRQMAEPSGHHSASWLKKAHLFVDISQRTADETPYVAPVWYSGQAFRELAPDLWGCGHPSPGLPEITGSDDLARMMAADALVYLPQDILAKVDRASMAASLEVRSPFLDRRVVELAFSFPRQWHRRGPFGKRMLADGFAGLLPGWVWRRRKHGFGVPLHRWFAGRLGDDLLERVHTDTGPLNAAAVDAMVATHRAGRRDLGLCLWQLYTYLKWRQSGLLSRRLP